MFDFGKFKNFISVFSYVKINRNFMILEFEGRYFVVKEFLKLDLVFLKLGWNMVYEIKFVVIYDNVIIYWEYLKG